MVTEDFNFSDYSTPLLRRKEKVKTCPKCRSVFVTESECEACGYQLKFDRLGEPFDHKSFFNTREEFQHRFKLQYLLGRTSFMKDNKELKRYLRTIKNRLVTLCDYFFESEDEDQERRKLFVFEAQEIIHELLLFGTQPSHLWLMLEKGEDHPFFQLLTLELRNAPEADSYLLKDFFSRFFSEELKRFPSWKTFGKLGLGAGFTIVAAWLVMKYLTLVH